VVEDYSENKPTIGVDEPPESGEQNGFTRQTADKTANMAANIPALTGHDLLAAIHQAEIDPAAPAEFSEDQEIHLEGRAIPLIPRLLSAPEIETLMQSEAYRTWYHPASEKVRDTVSEWFAITYPGPLNVDSSGRTIRSEDRHRPSPSLVESPDSLLAQLETLGPLSRQRAKRLKPRKPTTTTKASRQHYINSINSLMNTWSDDVNANK
jgi:hypothetical protein